MEQEKLHKFGLELECLCARALNSKIDDDDVSLSILTNLEYRRVHSTPLLLCVAGAFLIRESSFLGPPGRNRVLSGSAGKLIFMNGTAGRPLKPVTRCFLPYLLSSSISLLEAPPGRLIFLTLRCERRDFFSTRDISKRYYVCDKKKKSCLFFKTKFATHKLRTHAFFTENNGQPCLAPFRGADY